MRGLGCVGNPTWPGQWFACIETACRYARLHLHTPKGTSYLPDFPWPKGTPKYPSAAEVRTEQHM